MMPLMAAAALGTGYAAVSAGGARMIAHQRSQDRVDDAVEQTMDCSDPVALSDDRTTDGPSVLMLRTLRELCQGQPIPSSVAEKIEHASAMVEAAERSDVSDTEAVAAVEATYHDPEVQAILRESLGTAT